MQLAICWSGSYHLHQRRKKSNCSFLILTQFMGVLFGVIHTTTLKENLPSAKIAHSCGVLTRPDTPAQVWHMR